SAFFEQGVGLHLIATFDGTIVQTNPGWERLLGYKKSALEGRNFLELIHPEDQAETIAEVEQLAQGKTTFHFENRYRHQNGAYRLLAWSAIASPPRQLIFASAVDITDERAQKQQLMRERQRFSTILDTLPAFIYLQREDYTIDFCNLRFRQLFGDPGTRPCYSVIAGRDTPCEPCPTMEALRTHQKRRWEWTDNEGRIFQLFDHPIEDADGKLAVVEIGLEITDQRKAEREQRQLHKMEAMGQLTGGIAHDFNNILGIILGNVELLQRQLKEGDPKVQKRLLAVAKSGERAAKLTQQLLGFSRSKAVNTSRVNLNQLIQGLDHLIERALTPEIEVRLLLSEGLSSCHIDAGDFEDLLLNLCLNARDAMAGRGHLTLETRNIQLDAEGCRCHQDITPGEYIELAVSDDGCGMSAEVQNHLFEPFFTTKEHGTGLGLAMVFGFVKRSKGCINCYSEEGIGTTIRLYLPAQSDNDG
ncbi:MAG: PAS domain S-box protein, partial [Gammaproteobacteria bacterium]|nr:PAS domain S-box protein [Gammaproteobacteria bacterium]